MRRVAFVFALATLAPSIAHASAPDLFGQGSRSSSLAQADVAAPDPVVAAYSGPTSATEPGTRVSIGYSHAFPKLTFQGATAPIDDIGGTTFAFQLGRQATESLRLGIATSLYLPDRGLARVSFRAASEPSFLRWDVSPQRLEFDTVVAARVSIFSLAVGAAFAGKAAGSGIVLDLPQDARGPHADAQADVTLGYSAAPIVAIAADFGSIVLAARLRGPAGIGVDLATTVNVAFNQNPLNGTTNVHVAGTAGYDPLTLDVAARWSISSALRLFTSLQYARWRAAPPSISSFDLALALGITPAELHGGFDGPTLRDTLSPRLGLELAPADSILRARVGYAYSPSPVPMAQGFLTPIDPARHVLTLGGGLALEDVLGVDLNLDAHVGLHLATTDHETKANLAEPWSEYETGGHVWQMGASLGGAFR